MVICNLPFSRYDYLDHIITDENIKEGLLFKFPCSEAPWELPVPPVQTFITEFDDYDGNHIELGFRGQPVIRIKSIDGDKVTILLRCKEYVLSKEYIKMWGKIYKR